MEESRGRGKNKCYWKDDETQLLVDVLQDMSSDASWKTEGGFKSNYMNEVHRRILIKMPTFSKQVSPHIESKVKWLKTKFHIINDMVKQSGCQWNDKEKKIVCEKQWYDKYCQKHKEAKGSSELKFPFFNQLKSVYGRDDAIVAIVEGYGDANCNMVVEQNIESGGENHGESHVSLSDENENNVQYMSQATPTTSKQKTPPSTGDNKVAKRRKTSSSQDIGACLEGINDSFQSFVQGFNAKFAIMANTMIQDYTRQEASSEKMKDVIAELTKLNIPNDDVFSAADVFATNKDKIVVFLNLPQRLKGLYVQRLIRLSSSK